MKAAKPPIAGAQRAWVGAARLRVWLILALVPFGAAAAPLGGYELLVAGEFRGRTSCGALQFGVDASWIELVSAAAATTQRFHVPVDAPSSRLRYRFELRTGGAGTGPIVTRIELHSS